MKNILFTALILLTFTSCKTTQDIKIKGDKVYILPKKSKALTIDQIAQLFPDLGDKLLPSNVDKLYMVDDVLIGLSYKPNNPLAQSTKSFEYYKALYSSLTHGTGLSVINISLKDYNSEKFIVADYESKNDGFFEFRSFKTGYFNTYRGFVRYQNNSQKADATKILINILNQVKIKN